VAEIHRASSSLPATEHTIEHELAIATRAVDHVGRLASGWRGPIDELVRRLARLSTSTEPVSQVSLHGDLKLDHLHRLGTQLVVIDIDRAGHGEAAIDLGNLLADVRWWGRGLSDELVDHAAAAVGRGYSGAVVGAPRTRVMEAIGVLRIAGRRPRLASRSWLAETARMLSVADRLVGQAEQEIGLRAIS
jgi:aminoglycoside phosphotransferase (APT) family kinase protein